MPEVDPVPELTRYHFDEAFASARKSVTDTDLNKFKEFAQKYNPGYAGSVGISGSSDVPKKFRLPWPNSGGSKPVNVPSNDDLY